MPPKQVLISEVNFLEDLLTTKVSSPVVFCHNDLLLKNIVHFESPVEGVAFIDFEYADYNYQAFDIANHFCEFAGVDQFDPSLYPDKEFQCTWLRHYLRRRRQLLRDTNAVVSSRDAVPDADADADDAELDAEVEQMYVQVRKFTLAAHLFWGIWSLIQAEHSTINFDFLGYAVNRLNEYFARKSGNMNGHH